MELHISSVRKRWTTRDYSWFKTQTNEFTWFVTPDLSRHFDLMSANRHSDDNMNTHQHTDVFPLRVFTVSTALMHWFLKFFSKIKTYTDWMETDRKHMATLCYINMWTYITYSKWAMLHFKSVWMDGLNRRFGVHDELTNRSVLRFPLTGTRSGSSSETLWQSLLQRLRPPQEDRTYPLSGYRESSSVLLSPLFSSEKHGRKHIDSVITLYWAKSKIHYVNNPFS